MTKKIALFPGTFDPITLGHIDIVKRIDDLFDEVHIGVGSNSSKSTMFSTEQRVKWIKEVFKDNPKIIAGSYSGLTIDYCKIIKAKFIVRGIRYVSDFEYEKTISDANRTLEPKIETIILTSEPKYSSVASTIVRDLLRNNSDVSMFVPQEVVRSIKKNKLLPH